MEINREKQLRAGLVQILQGIINIESATLMLDLKLSTADLHRSLEALVGVIESKGFQIGTFHIHEPVDFIDK